MAVAHSSDSGHHPDPSPTPAIGSSRTRARPPAVGCSASRPSNDKLP